MLFQVFFHSCLAAEEGRFTVADVARGVRQKLVARHPHVFGDVVADSPAAVAANWEVLKTAEKGRKSVTDGVPSALPALALAVKLQGKGAAAGIEEAVPADVSRRAGEELDWLSRAQDGVRHPDDPGDHVGELLLAVADLARRLGVDPEDALRRAALALRDRIRAEEARVGPALAPG